MVTLNARHFPLSCQPQNERAYEGCTVNADISISDLDRRMGREGAVSLRDVFFCNLGMAAV